MTGPEFGLLVLLGAAVYIDEWPAFHTMLSRPIVVGPLAGWILGAPAQGAVWGAVFEAIHLALLPVGAARLPSAGLAALTGTAVAVWGQAGGVAPAALVVGVGILGGEIGGLADHAQRRWNGRTAERVRSAVAAGDTGAPGRGVAVALARAAAIGAVRTAAALAGAWGVWWLSGGGAWTGPLDRDAIVLAAAAAAGVAGGRLFAVGRGRAVAWGAGAGFGGLLAWLGAA